MLQAANAVVRDYNAEFILTTADTLCQLFSIADVLFEHLSLPSALRLLEVGAEFATWSLEKALDQRGATVTVRPKHGVDTHVYCLKLVANDVSSARFSDAVLSTTAAVQRKDKAESRLRKTPFSLGHIHVNACTAYPTRIRSAIISHVRRVR